MPILSGIFIEGRAIHVVANRYITVSPNARILGKGTQPAADIVISGILVSQDVTLNPAVQIGTGVRGVTIFAQNQDQITTAAAARPSVNQDRLKGVLAEITEVLNEMQQRSEEHTSELQSQMRISYDVFCLKTKKAT